MPILPSVTKSWRKRQILTFLGSKCRRFFGKCRLAFFVAFRVRRAIFMAFSNFPSKQSKFTSFQPKLSKKCLKSLKFQVEIDRKGLEFFKQTRKESLCQGNVTWRENYCAGRIKMGTNSSRSSPSHGLQIKRFKLFGTVKVFISIDIYRQRGQPGGSFGTIGPFHNMYDRAP